MFMRVFLGSHIPEETIRIAHAAFPKGNVCMQMRDALTPQLQRQQDSLLKISQLERKTTQAWSVRL